MTSIKRLFSFPGPKELGRAKYDALPSREFSPFTAEYTWQDYEEELKDKFPVKYFLIRTLYEGFLYGVWGQVRRVISSVYQWFRYHIWARYHIINISGVEPKRSDHYYKYGYLDFSEIIFFASFKCLIDYVRAKKARGGFTFNAYSPSEIRSDEHLREQAMVELEIVAIYDWYTIEQLAEQDASEQLYEKMNAAAKNKDKESYESLQQEWVEAYRALETKRQEMLCRLIAIRESLWT